MMVKKKKKEERKKKPFIRDLKFFSVGIFQLSWILFLHNSHFKEKNIYLIHMYKMS